MSTKFKMPNPCFYAYDWECDGNQITDWVTSKKEDIPKHMGHNIRQLYTSSDMRAVIEQCAQICVNHRSPLCGLPDRDAVMNNCEVEIRKLLEQVK